MNEIDSKFKSLRVNLRKHGVSIGEDVFKRVHPTAIKNKKEICVFCNSTSQITKEHVLPKWLFQKNTEVSFISSTNRQTQTYNKSVVPTCAVCNNSILAYIEKYMIKIIRAKKYQYSDDELNNIIRWLEIIDYKTQVYDCRRKYVKYGDSEYDYDWGEFSAAMMRHFYELNPMKAYDFLRSSQRRIAVKAKTGRINSLMVIKIKEPHLYFFGLPNEYIYVSLPMFGIAFFYFLRKKFNDYKDAARESIDIIDKVYKSS